MLESVLSTILNRYVGQYVNNLDPDNLRLGVWQGDIELQDLSLRRDALRDLHLPLDVRSGFLGRLVIKIPWANLRGKPVIVEMHDLYILAGPPNQGMYNAQEEADAMQTSKYQRLAVLNAFEAKELEEADSRANTAPIQSTLVDTIIDNAQVIIHNVHVRFEDAAHRDTSVFGLIMDRLSTRSADANYNPKYLSDHQLIAHKLLSVENVTVYADEAGEFWSDMINQPYNLKQKFVAAADPESAMRERFHYILRPTTMSGRMRRVKTKQAMQDVPTITLEFDVGEIPLTLTQDQLKNINTLMQTFSVHVAVQQRRRRLFRRVAWARPRERIQDISPDTPTEERWRVIRDWWRYGCEAVKVISVHPGGDGSTLRIDPAYIKRRQQQRADYVQLWIRTLTTHPIKAADKNRLDDLEAELTLDDIINYRSRAKLWIAKDAGLTAAMRRCRRAKATEQQAGSTWYSWFFGASAKATEPEAAEEEDPAEEEAALFESISESQRQAFLSALSELENPNLSASTQDVDPSHVFLRVSFKLERGCLTLCGTASPHTGAASPPLGEPPSVSPVAELEFVQLQCGFETRPAVDGVAFEIQLQAMNLYDARSAGDTTQPIVCQKAVTAPTAPHGAPATAPSAAAVAATAAAAAAQAQAEGLEGASMQEKEVGEAEQGADAPFASGSLLPPTSYSTPPVLFVRVDMSTVNAHHAVHVKARTLPLQVYAEAGWLNAALGVVAPLMDASATGDPGSSTGDTSSTLAWLSETQPSSEPTRMVLDVNISAPVLVLPNGSGDVVVLNFGLLKANTSVGGTDARTVAGQQQLARGSAGAVGASEPVGVGGGGGSNREGGHETPPKRTRTTSQSSDSFLTPPSSPSASRAHFELGGGRGGRGLGEDEAAGDGDGGHDDDGGAAVVGEGTRERQSQPRARQEAPATQAKGAGKDNQALQAKKRKKKKKTKNKQKRRRSKDRSKEEGQEGSSATGLSPLTSDLARENLSANSLFRLSNRFGGALSPSLNATDAEATSTDHDLADTGVSEGWLDSTDDDGDDEDVEDVSGDDSGDSGDDESDEEDGASAYAGKRRTWAREQHEIRLEDVQVLACAESEWQQLLEQGVTERHIVRSFSIGCTLNRHMPSEGAQLVEFSSELEEVAFVLDEWGLRTLLSCLKVFSTAAAPLAMTPGEAENGAPATAAAGDSGARGSVSADTGGRRAQGGGRAAAATAAAVVDTTSAAEAMVGSVHTMGSDEDMVVRDRSQRMPLDTQLVLANFKLRRSSFELRGARRRRLLAAELNSVCLDYQKRPYDDHVTLSVQSFLLEDPMQSADSEYRQLVAMKSARANGNGTAASQQDLGASDEDETDGELGASASESGTMQSGDRRETQYEEDLSTSEEAAAAATTTTTTTTTTAAALGEEQPPFVKITYVNLRDVPAGYIADRYHGLPTQHSQFPLGFTLQGVDTHVPPHIVEVTLGDVCIVFNREVVAALLEFATAALSVASAAMQDAAPTADTAAPSTDAASATAQRGAEQMSTGDGKGTTPGCDDGALPPSTGPGHSRNGSSATGATAAATHASTASSAGASTTGAGTERGNGYGRRKIKVTASMSLLDVLLVGNGDKLARASFRDSCVRMDAFPSFTRVCGRLGSLSLRDLTPCGFLYRDVFSTTGSEVLSFELTSGCLSGARDIVLLDEESVACRQRSDCPDLHYTTDLSVRMASVRYVHTRRFMTIMQNYVTQFQSPQVVERVQTAAKEMVEELKQRYTEELMRVDLQVDTPIVVVPRNSFSPHVVEAYLGKTHVSHGMRLRAPGHAVKDGTTPASGDGGNFYEGYALVDCLLLDVRDVRLLSATVMSDLEAEAHRTFANPVCSSNLDDSDDASSACSSSNDLSFYGRLDLAKLPDSLAATTGFHHLHTSAHPEMLSDCHMHILFEQNLTPERRDLPMVRLECSVSDVNARADNHQFDLILSILDENLGCETELLATQDLVELATAVKTRDSRRRSALSAAEAMTSSPLASAERTPGSHVDGDDAGAVEEGRTSGEDRGDDGEEGGAFYTPAASRVRPLRTRSGNNSTSTLASSVLRDLDEALNTRLETEWHFLPGVPTGAMQQQHQHQQQQQAGEAGDGGGDGRQTGARRSGTGSSGGEGGAAGRRSSRHLRTRWRYLDLEDRRLSPTGASLEEEEEEEEEVRKLREEYGSSLQVVRSRVNDDDDGDGDDGVRTRAHGERRVQGSGGATATAGTRGAGAGMSRLMSVPEEAPSLQEQWVGLEFELKLANVHLGLYDTQRCQQQRRQHGHVRMQSTDSDNGQDAESASTNRFGQVEEPLANLHLLRTALSFTSYENNTLDDLGITVRLYSTAIAVDNALPDEGTSPNLYRRVLEPMPRRGQQRGRASQNEKGDGGEEAEAQTRPGGGDGSGTEEARMEQARQEERGTPALGSSKSAFDGAGGDAGSAPQLEVTCTLKPQSNQLHVLLSRTRVFISPEWALRVLDFAISRPESGLKKLHTQRKPFLQEKYMDIKAPPLETPTHTRVTLNITNPELIMVDDVTSPTSEALVLKVCNVTKLKMNEFPAPDATATATPRPPSLPTQAGAQASALLEDYSLALDMEDFEIFTCRMDNQARTQLSIVDPCGFSLEATRKVEQGAERKAATNAAAITFHGAQVGSEDQGVDARISYNDLVLVMSIVKRFGDWVSSKQQQQQQQEQEEDKEHSSDDALATSERGERDKVTERRRRRERHVAVARLRLIEDDTTLCLETLSHFNGNYEAAALALCEHVHTTGTTWSSSKQPRFATSFHMPRTLTPVAGTQLLKMWFQQHILHKRFQRAEERLSSVLAQRRETQLAVQVAQEEGDMERAEGLQDELASHNRQIDLLSAQFAMVSAEVSAVLADTGLESFAAKKPHPIDALVRLGFNEADCAMALAANYGSVEAATSWLFENAPRTGPGDHSPAGKPTLSSDGGGKDDSLRDVEDVEDVDDIVGEDHSADDGAVQATRASALSALARLGKQSGHEGPVDRTPSMAAVLDKDATPPGVVSRVDVMLASQRSQEAEAAASAASNSRSEASGAGTGRDGGKASCAEEKEAEDHAAVEEHGTVRFTFHSLCLGLIDDSHGKDVPLLEGKLERVLARLSATQYSSSDMTVHLYADCRVTCSAFNPELSAWEPIVEPWTPTLVVTYKQEEKNPELLFKMTTEQRLELVLCPNLINHTLPTLSSWTKAYSSEDLRVVREAFVPYRFHNETGIDVELLLGDRTVSITSGTSEDLSFEQRRDKHRQAMAMAHAQAHRVGFRLSGFHQCMEKVNVDRLGKYVHIVRRREDKVAFRILVEVTLEHGRKHIYFTSSLLVENKLSVAVDLRLFDPHTSTTFDVGRIDSKEKLAVHLLHTRDSLCFRPSSQGFRFSVPLQTWGGRSRPGAPVGRLLSCDAIADTTFDTTPETFHCYASIVEHAVRRRDPNLPCHTITLVPPLVIANLLPVDVRFEIVDTTISDSLSSGQSQAMNMVNLSHNLSMRIKIDKFAWSNVCLIHTTSSRTATDAFIHLHDATNRTLRVRIVNHQLQNTLGARVVHLVADYWLINQTQLPLTFVDHNMDEAMPSHAAPDTCDAIMFTPATNRTQTKCRIKFGRSSVWSQSIPIDTVGSSGSVDVSAADVGADLKTYQVGVEVSKGAGRFFRTKTVRFVPRFVVVNRTSRELLVCQHQQPFSAVLCHAPAGESVPYHFPDLRIGGMVCIKYGSGSTWSWSTPLPLGDPGTVHVKMWRSYGALDIARVDVRLHGASTQMIVSDSTDTPPFRIVNESMISLKYHQDNSTPSYTLHPGEQHAFAWDDLCTSPMLIVGSCTDKKARTRFDLQRIRARERFRYSQQFFITGPDGLVVGARPTTRDRHIPACLVTRRSNDPMQLWRFFGHELINKAGFRLEVSTDGLAGAQVYMRKWNPSPRPGQPGTAPTQMWKFEQGRLLSFKVVLTSSNSLQRGTPYALHALSDSQSATGNDGALLIVSPAPTRKVDRSQAFRSLCDPPGSGAVVGEVTSDGATRVLTFHDAAELERKQQQSQQEDTLVRFEVTLDEGVGLSLIDDTARALLYGAARGVLLTANRSLTEDKLSLSIYQLQIDNQSNFSTRKPAVLWSSVDGKKHQRALQLRLQRTHDKLTSCMIFHNLEISVSPLRLRLEELVLFRVLSIFHSFLISNQTQKVMHPSETLFLAASDDDLVHSLHKKPLSTLETPLQMFFEVFNFSKLKIEAACYPSSLPPELQELKQELGIIFYGFENKFRIEAFSLSSPFVNQNALSELIADHFKQQIMWQLFKLVMSSDAFGNLLGLGRGLGRGVSDFIKHTRRGRLLTGAGLFATNVANSVADTTSKLSKTVSTVFSDRRAAKDAQARREHQQPGVGTAVTNFTDNFVGGIRGFFSRPIEGAKQTGARGFVKGVFQGTGAMISGTVGGSMSFVSDMSEAIKETTALGSNPERIRLPRCIGPDLIITPYDLHLARNQLLLYNLNGFNLEERLLSTVKVCELSGQIAMVSSDRLIILDQRDGVAVVSEVWFCGMHKHAVVSEEAPSTTRYSVFYVEFLNDPIMEQEVRRSLEMNGSRHLSIIRPLAALAEAQQQQHPHHRPTSSSPSSSSSSSSSLRHRGGSGGHGREERAKRRMRLRCDTREIAIDLFHRVDHASRLFRESQNKCRYFDVREALAFQQQDS